MDKLQKLLDEFRNDATWNTQNRDGSHRFDKEILWIESMLMEYAEKLDISVDKVVELAEKRRSYSWPNYYQESNFPPLDSDGLIGVFETYEAFRTYAGENYSGFKCSSCGNVGKNPEECDHRIAKDDICDWCSFGLFKSGISVIVLESGLRAIPIFEPVLKRESEKG